MAVIDITAQNIKKMLSDAKHMYELGISDIDCILTKEKFVMRASTAEEKDFDVKVTHVYLKKSWAWVGVEMEGHSTSAKSSQSYTEEASCICSIFKPDDLDEDAASYRCVTPGDLIKSLRAVDEFLSKGHLFWKKIQIAMDDKFYVRVHGNVANQFLLNIRSEPDVVQYDDSDVGSESFGRVDWHSMINCG